MGESVADLEKLLRELLQRVAEERNYLTIDEVAERLKLSRKTAINRMVRGIYREGVHYFRPRGVDKVGKAWQCDPLFKWSAVAAWIEGGQPGKQAVGPSGAHRRLLTSMGK